MKKIAVTIRTGNDLNATLDPRFGRAERFLLVDADEKSVLEVLENPSIQAAHGAGTGSAAMMNQAGVTAVISGRFGPKAHSALSQLGIEMFAAPEDATADSALEDFLAGRLERIG